MKIKKYLTIYKIFINNGFSYLAQYRKDTWFNMILHVAYVGMLLLVIEIIFSQTNSIVGWSKHEVYVLTLIWQIVDEIYTIVFTANISRISRIITAGDLDLLLAKPVSSLFMVSTNRVFIRGLYRLIISISLLVGFLNYYHITISLFNWSLTLLMMFCGIVVLYSISLFFNTFGFWFHRIDNINDAIGALNTLGRYPIDVFPRLVRVIGLTIIPIGFVAYVPTSVAFSRFPHLYIPFVCFGTLLMFSLVVKFWHYATKRYTSASS